MFTNAAAVGLRNIKHIGCLLNAADSAALALATQYVSRVAALLLLAASW